MFTAAGGSSPWCGGTPAPFSSQLGMRRTLCSDVKAASARWLLLDVEPTANQQSQGGQKGQRGMPSWLDIEAGSLSKTKPIQTCSNMWRSAHTSTTIRETQPRAAACDRGVGGVGLDGDDTAASTPSSSISCVRVLRATRTLDGGVDVGTLPRDGSSRSVAFVLRNESHRSIRMRVASASVGLQESDADAAQPAQYAIKATLFPVGTCATGMRKELRVEISQLNYGSSDSSEIPAPQRLVHGTIEVRASDGSTFTLALRGRSTGTSIEIEDQGAPMHGVDLVHDQQSTTTHNASQGGIRKLKMKKVGSSARDAVAAPASARSTELKRDINRFIENAWAVALS